MTERNVSVRLMARVDQYIASMDKAKAATAGMSSAASKQFKQLGGTMQSVGSSMTKAVTLPLAAVGGAAVKMSIDFDTAFARMQGLAGVTADEIDGLKQSVLDLAGETGRGPQELASALYFLRSSGLDAQNAMEALDVSAKASAAGLGSTATIADAVSSAMNAYAKSGLSAADATDILVATARAGKAEPEELAGALGRVLPIAAELGVSFEDVGGAVAAFSLTGNDASQSVTFLSNVLLKLLKPSQQSADALAAVGMSTDTIRQSIAENGLQGTLEDLRNALGDSGFTTFMEDAQAVTGALALTGDNLATAGQAFDGVKDHALATGEAFDAMAKTSGFKMRQSWSEVQVAMIQAGDIIVPIVREVAGAFGVMAEKFSSLPHGAQMVVVGFLAVAAAAGPLLNYTGKLVSNFEKVNDAFRRHPQMAGNAAAGLSIVGVAMVGLSMHAKAVADRNREVAESIAALSTVGDDQLISAWMQLIADSVLDGGPKKAIDSLTDSNIEGARRTLEALKAQQALGNNSSVLATQIDWLTTSITAQEAADSQGAKTNELYGSSTKKVTDTTDDRREAIDAFLESQKKVPLTEQQVADAMQLNEDATKRLHDALQPLSTMFDTMAHEADVMNSALQRVLGGSLSMEDATAGLYSEAQALTDAFKDNGKTLDIATEAGRKNRAVVEGSVKGIIDYGSAIVGAGGSTDDATAAMKFLRQGLIDQMVHLGLTTDAAEAYVTQLGLTPTSITTAVTIANDDLTRESLQAMIDDLGTIDAGAAARIQVLVDHGQLDAAERSLNNLVRTRAAAVIISRGGNAAAHADGGYIGHQMLSWLGEGGLPEVVMPLTKPGRIRALMSDPRVSGPILNAAGPIAVSAAGRTVNLTHTSIAAAAAAAPAATATAPASNETDEITLARRQYQRGVLSLQQFEDILEKKRAGLALYSDDEQAIYDELQQLHETKARDDAALADEQIAHEDKVQQYLYDSGQITLAQYMDYLTSRQSAFQVMSDEWFALNDKIVAAQRDGDRAIADGTQLLFDQAAARQELADATEANIAADAARNDAATKAWKTGADKNATTDDKNSANEALKHAEEALAATAFRLADATANARGIDDKTPEWAQFMRERLQADIAWNSAQGNTTLVEALQRELLGIPAFAAGGFMPSTPGGRLVRVAEGGQGEYMVPADQMGRLIAGGGGGGTTVVHQYHISVEAPPTYDAARGARDLVDMINRQLVSSGHTPLGGR